MNNNNIKNFSSLIITSSPSASGGSNNNNGVKNNHQAKRSFSPARTAKITAILIISIYAFLVAFILCALYSPSPSSSLSSSSSTSSPSFFTGVYALEQQQSSGQTPSRSYSPPTASADEVPNYNTNTNNNNIPKFEAGASHLNIEGIQRGVSVESIRAGQHHLTLQLVGGSARFARHLTNDDRLALLRKLFNSVPSTPSSGIVHADFAAGTWDTYKNQILGSSHGALATVSTSGRSMKITLGSASDFELDIPERVLISTLSSSSSSIATTGGIPSDLLVRGSAISAVSNKDFIIFPDGRLDINVMDTGTPMVSHSVLLDIGLAHNANTSYPLKLMRGRDCRSNSFLMDVPWPSSSSSNKKSSSSSPSSPTPSPSSDESTIVEFVPTSGSEQVTICYVPHGEEVSSLLGQDPIYIAAVVTSSGKQNGFSISGPTFSGSRSLAVGETVTTQILGFNLTYDDVAALTPSGQCDAVDINSALPLSMYISSTSLAEVQVQAQEVGVYDLCYYREGAASFVPVATYAVTHTDGRHKTHDVNVSKGISVDLSGNVYSANFRVLDGGVVRLNSHQVNTTHFEWKDGTIEGWGGINCQMGTEPHVIEAAANREISVQIQNFGIMYLHVDHLHFSGQGLIHNHRHLTIVAESPKALMNTADHIAKRILNGVRGRIDFVIGSSSSVAEVLHPVLISTALIENMGMVVVSPHMQVKLRRMLNHPTGILQLQFGSTALIESGVIEGELETDSDSVLGFAGDIVLSGTNFVTADKSHLLFNAVHFLKLANVHVRGSGQVVLHSLISTSSSSKDTNEFGAASGRKMKNSYNGVVALEGTTIFDKNTLLAIKNVTLTADRNIAYLNVLGRFVCHVPSVVLGDNIVMSAHLNSVLFGSGVESARVVPQRVPPNNSAFVLPENASLILVDVDHSNGFYHSSNMPGTPFSSSSSSQQQEQSSSSESERRNKNAIATGATTQVCSQYLVVPVHVVLSGDVQLLGCVMLPLGGQTSGNIYSSSAADIIEATSKFAFCKTALSGKSSGKLGTTDSSTASPNDGTNTAENKEKEDIEKIVKVPGDVCISLGSGDDSSSGVNEYELIERLLNAKKKQEQQAKQQRGSSSSSTSNGDEDQDPAVATNANLALGGTHTFVDDSNDRNRNGGEVIESSTLRRMKPQLDIDRLEVLPQAMLEATAVVKLLVKRGILVRPESAIALSLGGLIGSTIMTLEGTLVLDSQFPLLINGTMQAESTASLLVRAWEDSLYSISSKDSGNNNNALAHYFGDKSSSSSHSKTHKQLAALYSFFTGTENTEESGAYCSYPLQVAGGCTFLAGSKILIDGRLSDSDNANANNALALVHANLAIVGVPLIRRVDEDRIFSNASSSSSNELATTTISIVTPRSVSAATRPKIDLPTPYRKKLAICFVIITAAVATLYFYARIGRKFVDELLAEPTYPMWLGIAEFWNSMLNWIAVAAYSLEIFLLCAPAFHETLFIPPQFEFARWSLSWMVSANHDSGSWNGPYKYFLLCGLDAIFVVMWLWLYIVRSDPESQRSASAAKQRWFGFVQQLCTFMTFIGLTLFIPITATLMEPITCKFLFRGAFDCHHAEQYLIIGTLSLLAFLVLAPLSGTSLTTPFSHPPFMRDLDIRYKRTYVHLQCVLLGAMISCWKIFSRNAFQLQLAHLFIVVLMFFLYRYSHPCIYENINVVRQALFVIPIFASLAALMQLARYDGNPLIAKCDMTVEYGYVVVFVSGFIICFVLIARFLSRGHNPADFPSFDRGASVARNAVLYCFGEVERIQLRMYNAGTANERARLAEDLADKRVEYQQALQVLRKKLAPLQTKYYLGDEATQIVDGGYAGGGGDTSMMPIGGGGGGGDDDDNNSNVGGDENGHIMQQHHRNVNNNTTANFVEIMNRVYTGMNDDDDEELQPTNSNQWLVGDQHNSGSVPAGTRKKIVNNSFGRNPLGKNNNNRNNNNGNDDDDSNNNNNNNNNDIPICAVATADELRELTPEQMSNYTEGPVLGRGTYGTVYMAMLSIGKLVAVKVVPIIKKQKTESLNSIKREVDVLRNMSHPNVIRCYGCSYPPKKDSICIFMELATSGSLTQIVRRFGGLNENVVQVYTKQILKGLQYLHNRGVIHRDIKGENILIDGNGAAKLGDFGCSKFLQDVANKSQAGCASLVGSPFWMAPEVIRNENYGTKADVWSLGCTVVEMLNGGHPPWSETFDNVYSAMYFIGNTTSLPSNIPVEVSDLCTDFLAKCFERDVTKRASVTDLLNHAWLSEDNMGSPLTPDQLHTAIQHGGNISANHLSHSTATLSQQNSAFASHRAVGEDEDEEENEEENDTTTNDDDEELLEVVLEKKNNNNRNQNNNNEQEDRVSTPSTTTNNNNNNQQQQQQQQNGQQQQQPRFMPGRGWSGLFEGLESSGGNVSHMTGDSTFNPSTLSGDSHTAGSTF